MNGRKIRDNRISLPAGELCYLLFFGILLFAKGIGLYDGQRIFTVLLVIACLFWCGKILLTEHTVGELAVMAVLLVLGILSYRTTGEKAALVNIMVVAGMKNMSAKRVMKAGAAVWTVCFAGTTILALNGWIGDTIFVHVKLGLGHLIRYSLGYTHPNVLHVSFVVLLAFFFYAADLNRRQLLTASAAAFALNLYIFLYSVSYTGFVLTVLYLLLNLYFHCRRSFSKAENLLIQCVFPLCVLLSVLGPVLTSGRLFEFMNSLMNTRWTLSRYFLTQQEIGLFGTIFTDIPSSSYSIDCSYVYVLMYYGVILFVLAFLACCRTVQCELRQQDRSALPILLAFFIGGMVEPFLANFSFKNLTLIFMGECLYAAPLIKVSSESAFGRFWNRPVRLTPCTGAQVILPVGRKGTGSHADPKEKAGGDGAGGCTSRFAGAKVGSAVSAFQSACPWNRLRGKGRLILAAGLLAGMLVGGICWVVTPAPEVVYVDVLLSDATGFTEDDFVFPDEEELPEDWNGIIIGTADGQTKMWELHGNTVTMERFRDAVTMGLEVGVLSAAMTAAGMILTGRRRERGSRSEKVG